MPSRRERIQEALDTAWKRTHEGPELSREEAIFFLGVFTAFIQDAHKREDAIHALPLFAKEMNGEMEVAAEGAHGEWMRADDVLAILDGET